MATNESATQDDYGIADDQTSFAGRWHADQARLDDVVDDDCACDELPEGVPCFDHFDGQEFGVDAQ